MQRPVELQPGVASFAALTPTLPPATHTQSYALGTRQLVLVEPATPYDDERRAWLDWARALMAQGRELVALLVTHHHGDHVGGAEFLSRELGTPLWAHPETARRLQVPVARELEDGEFIELDGPAPQRWQVLHTPGHAPGHVCLHEPTLGVVVVGDMVASIGTILIDPGDGDLRDYLKQLQRLEALRARWALPAHGDAIPEPSAYFAHYVRHRGMREDKVLAALGATGGGDLGALVAVAYDDTPQAIWPLAVRSLESHLIKLVSEGRARRTDRGWELAA
jgi:endoribonuclease LACTB2